MNKFKILEYIKHNLDKDNYIESFAKLAMYLEENGIVLSEEDISYLINNVPVIRYMLDNSLKDDNDIEANSLLSSFLDVYFSLDDEKYSSIDTNYLNVYLREISVYPRLSKEDEYNLGKKVQAGDKEARDTLILHNLRLSVSVAKRYLYTNISLRDLIEEGNVGLIHAAKYFNPDKGAFSTYAFIHIKRAILRSIPKCYTDITMSDHAFSKYRAYGYVVNKYITEKGVVPTDEEVAKMLNITLEEVLEIKTYNPNAASLESFYEGEDNKGYELLFVKDDIDDKIDDIMRATDVKELIDSTLSEREQDILKKRYGLYDGVCYTLDEIARDYHVTRERIRKIVETSLKRLKNSDKSAKFVGEYPSSRVKRL